MLFLEQKGRQSDMLDVFAERPGVRLKHLVDDYIVNLTVVKASC